MGRDETSYMSDTLGLYRISNADVDQVAVSLYRTSPVPSLLDALR